MSLKKLCAKAKAFYCWYALWGVSNQSLCDILANTFYLCPLFVSWYYLINEPNFLALLMAIGLFRMNFRTSIEQIQWWWIRKYGHIIFCTDCWWMVVIFYIIHFLLVLLAVNLACICVKAFSNYNSNSNLLAWKCTYACQRVLI